MRTPTKVLQEQLEVEERGVKAQGTPGRFPKKSDKVCEKWGEEGKKAWAQLTEGRRKTLYKLAKKCEKDLEDLRFIWYKIMGATSGSDGMEMMVAEELRQ